MSRAFVKEDVDPPERRGRKRSAAGLPPGATNYITRRGAERRRMELKALRDAGGAPERIAELEGMLDSVEIVDPAEPESKSVWLGASVTLEVAGEEAQSYTVVGVDEVPFEPNGVSWIAPLGKTLLAARLGDRITLEDGRTGRIVKIA